MPETEDIAVLDGIVIVDLTQNQVGQAACSALADLGADVVHVARPDYGASRGDARRPAAGRGERSIALDLKQPRGREILQRLVARADVVVEGFRPGALDALGLGFETLQRWRPGLILCSVTGYGQDGPYHRRPGHDLNFQGVAGALGHDGEGVPALPTSVWANRCASLRVESAILAALLGRRGSDAGRHLDVAIVEAAVVVPSRGPAPADVARVPSGGPPGSEAPLGPHVRGERAWYGLYRCADDRWLSIACVEPGYWRRFCALTDHPDWTARHGAATAEQQALVADLAQLFASRPRDAWLELLADELPVAPVHREQDVVSDHHLVARGAVVEAPVGADIARWQLGPRAADGRSHGAVARGLTLAGQDTTAILRELGCDDDEIAALLAAGAAAQT